MLMTFTLTSLYTLHSLCRTFRKWLNASGVAREQAQKGRPPLQDIICTVLTVFFSCKD